ncbi:MAG: fluoride efflux transporter CrcB [Clostridia bacterium]|nr:fluoride efflux transporter CrcB [Clostridia bacterium]
MIDCLLVALGGGLGAVGRYVLGLISVPVDFPFMTLCINFIGAVAIGAVMGLAGALPLEPRAVLFLKTGLCGGFTTFSTFSLETVNLLENGRYAAGAGYAAASVGLCLLGVLLGRMMVKGFRAA